MRLRLSGRRSSFRLFRLSLFGLLLGAPACLTPPGALPGGAGAKPKVAAAAIPSFGDFSRPAAAVLAKLRLGWNLGNSLEVPGGETTWGNPEATPELFVAVAKAGFKMVRIPVTWATHTSDPPGLVIDADWLTHVKDVVDYARAAGLYVIINLHHDGADGMKDVGWLSLKDEAGQTTPAHNAQVKERFVKVWAQIAKFFAGYGEELIFESMNEIHDGYGKPDPRHFTFINELNQAFVDLVRRSGGNNDKRYLLVPGYNTNIDHTLDGFKLPSDSATLPGRLILSVHYYDPYLFALMATTHVWGLGVDGRDDWGQEDFVVKQLDRIKAAFVDKGVPVIIGEFGATHQDDFADYQRYYVEYVTKAAVDRGMTPVYWDNGGLGSGQDKFALIDRGANEVLLPKVMEALVRAATSDYTLKDVVPAGGPKARAARDKVVGPEASQVKPVLTVVPAASSPEGDAKPASSEAPGTAAAPAAVATTAPFSPLPPPPPTDNVPQPSGKGTNPNLRVLPWAGFKAAVTYTFDDSQPSHVEHWPELKAAGVRMTFFLNPSDKWGPGDDVTWTAIGAAGNELGNHTRSHCRADMEGCPRGVTVDQELDTASAYIVGHLGAKAVYSFAAPFGDARWNEHAASRFLIGRGVVPGVVFPSGTTDWYNLPCFPVAAGQDAAAFNKGLDRARASGAWVIYLYHSILPTAANFYAGVPMAAITETITYAKSLRDVWIGTMADVGAYARAQQVFEATKPSGHTWTWKLPPHFPPGKALRVTVDGGTLSQGGKPLPWDPHGYYQVALDAGSLTWSR